MILFTFIFKQFMIHIEAKNLKYVCINIKHTYIFKILINGLTKCKLNLSGINLPYLNLLFCNL